MYQAILVDDEPIVLEGLVHAIDWEGYGFEIALAETSPLRALEYVRENAVHLLVTDVSMPRMSGLELMRQCREVHPLLAVLVISAFDRFEYVRTAMREGAENYLLKPVDEGELSETVGQLAGSLREREAAALRQVAGMLPFEANFVESWLRDSLSSSELHTRAGLLGIDLEAGGYTAALFATPEDDEQTMPRFYDFLMELAKGRCAVYSFFETKARLCCVLAPQGEGRTARAFVDKALHRARLMGLPVAACVGETVASATAVHRSFRAAEALWFMLYSGREDAAWAPDYALPEALAQRVEQSLSGMPQREYMESVAGALAEGAVPPDVLAVAVARWCLRQHGGTGADFFRRYPQLARIAGTLPPRGAGAREALAFCAEVVGESYRLLSGVQSTMHPCVEAVIAAVHEFSDKDISLKTLANRLNVSPSYLGNAFRQQTGVYFNDYLTTARLNYAARLIVETDMKMKDIVDKVGFSSQTYFNRTFKHQFSLSPVAYRRIKRA